MADKIRRAAKRALRPSSDPVAQLALMQSYRQGECLPSLSEAGFRAFSQTDEDGILLFLITVVGAPNRTCVELGTGSGVECNTANLLLTHHWDGLLIDGNADAVAQGQQFYAEHPQTRIFPPTVKHAWITRKSINDLIGGEGFSGEIDVLSIDLDGIDWWTWEALEVVSPRIVVVEYQDILGPGRSLTVPYSEDFYAWNYPVTDGMPNFAGASLAAFIALAKRKGYRFVGTNSYGYNAFFLRSDVGEMVPTGDPAAAFRHRKVQAGMASRWPLVAHLPWVEVTDAGETLGAT